MADWEAFFEKHRDYSVQASFYECRRDFTMEELYQAFKARLLDDLVQAADQRGDDELAAALERATSNGSDVQ